MSKTNEFIRYAKLKGYTVNKQGELFNSKGKAVKGTIKRKKKVENRIGKGQGGTVSEYHYFTVTDPKDGYKSYPVPTHRFIAYMKYGEDALKEGILTRHLNDKSLDNSWHNIEIGTAQDNHLDAVKNGKAQPRKVTL